MGISIFYREAHLAVDVNTLTSGGNKRPLSIKQSWSENSSGLLEYAGPCAPTRNNNFKQESYLLITTKINCKSGSAWPTCFSCRKNGKMLHSLNKGKHKGQMKHDSQNISGCVCLFDSVKTLNPQWRNYFWTTTLMTQ